MKLINVEATTIPDAWFQCVSKILDEGKIYTIDRGSYAEQKRLELDYITIRIKYPFSRPLITEFSPMLNIPSPVTEKYIEEYLPYLMTDIKKEGESYTYGEYIVPQMEKIIKMFKEDGYNTNQAYMTIGDPSHLNLDDPACLRGIDCRISDNKLHFMLYFRSWDCYSGLPANLAGLQLVKEYMASCIGVEDGEIIASSKGLHLYDYTWEVAQIVTGRKDIKVLI